jgi:hypothetical protein
MFEVGKEHLEQKYFSIFKWTFGFMFGVLFIIQTNFDFKDVGMKLRSDTFHSLFVV